MQKYSTIDILCMFKIPKTHFHENITSLSRFTRFHEHWLMFLFMGDAQYQGKQVIVVVLLRVLARLDILPTCVPVAHLEELHLSFIPQEHILTLCISKI